MTFSLSQSCVNEVILSLGAEGWRGAVAQGLENMPRTESVCDLEAVGSSPTQTPML